MFKGLKSKIESKLVEEAQKIRTRFDGDDGVSGRSSPSRLADSISDVLGVGDGSSSTAVATGRLVDVDGGEQQPQQQTSSLMQEVELEEGEVPLRLRRSSGGSVGSVDSFVAFGNSTIAGISSASRLEPIQSDLENTTDVESNAGSTFVGGASKEQISTVLHKLQGRAANYKDKYRELVKQYNELVRDNEKFKLVLVTTQDKALQRIDKLRGEKKKAQVSIVRLEQEARTKFEDSERTKKLEELLVRCKENIKANKDRIAQLTAENETLRSPNPPQIEQQTGDEEGETAVDDLVLSRVAFEWRTKLEAAEKRWSERLAEAEEKAVMAVAEAKKNMHAQMEERDQTVELLQSRLRNAEIESATTTSRLNDDIEESKRTVEALESEKQELIEKLTKSKQEIVKVLQDEEEKRKSKLTSDFDEMLKVKAEEHEKTLTALKADGQEDLAKQASEYEQKLIELREQMQLAVEEREMQKVAAVGEQDRRNDELICQVEELKTEKLQLESGVLDLKSAVSNLTEEIERNSSRHNEELEEKSRIMEQIEAELTAGRESLNTAQLLLQEKTAELDHVKGAAEKAAELKSSSEEKEKDLDKKVAEMQQKVDRLTSQEFDMENELFEKIKEVEYVTEAYKLAADEMADAKKNLEVVEEKYEQIKLDLTAAEQEITKHQNENVRLREEIHTRTEQSKAQQHTEQADADEQKKKGAEFETRLADQSKEFEQLKEKHICFIKNVAKIQACLDSAILEKDNAPTADVEQEMGDDGLKVQMSTIQARLMSLISQLTEQKNEITRLYEELKQSELSRNQWEETMRQYGSELRTSKNSILTFEDELSCLKAERQNWSVEQEKILVDKTNLENALAQLTDQIQNLKAEAEVCKTSEQTVKELEASFIETRAELDGVKQDKAKLTGQIDTETADKEAISKTLEHLASKLERVINLHSEDDCGSVSELDEVVGETSELDELGEQGTLIRRLHQFAVRLENCAKRTNDQMSQSSADVQQEMCRKDAEIGQLKAELQQQLESHQANLEKSTSLCRSLESEFGGLQEEVERHKAATEAAQLESHSKELELASARSDLDSALLKAKEEKDEWDAVLEKCRTDAEARVSEHKKKAEAYISKVKKQDESDLQAKQSTVDELAEQLTKTETNVSVLEGKLEEKEAKLATLLSDLDAKAAEVGQLKRDCQMAEHFKGEISRLEADLLEKQDRVDKVLSDSNDSTLRNEERENKLQEMESLLERVKLEHNDVVKQMLKEFEETLIRKEEDWRTFALDEKYSDDHHEIPKEVHRLNNELAARAAKFDEVKGNYDALLKDKDMEISELRATLEEVEHEDSDMSVVKVELQQEEITKLNGRVVELENELEEVEEKYRKHILLVERFSNVSSEPLEGSVIRLNQPEPMRNGRTEFPSDLATYSSFHDDSLTEATEIEYLRNVLYRYMTERESLGKESVTLARVIATVLKMDAGQMAKVMASEETRTNGIIWTRSPTK